ncbi:MAG: alpha-ketoacid dehydrogenase subunit beta, partial [Acidimicrobiales bacterium]
MKVLDSLNAGLRRCLASDDRVVLLGEDILDPYGGAFKVTRGLSTDFGDRVLTTPVSEAGIVGLATGMALRGLRPVVEIMFGDFTTLIVDQLLNHASKFAAMYGRDVSVPLVVRTPMGGRRGYGPTHSQTIEKLFMGIPGLRVVAPSALGDPGALLASAVLQDDGPVLFVENKVLYNCDVRPAGDGDDDLACAADGASSAPAYVVSVRHGQPATITIAAYGYMAELAREAVLRLAYEFEVFAELIVPTVLAPHAGGPIATSLRRTGRLLVVEEGTRSMGWGAEVVASALEDLGGGLAARRVATDDIVLPAASPVEAAVLPDVDELVKA